MPYANPEDGNTHYRTLDDLVLQLLEQPNQLFLRDNGYEALVYVEELDQILLIDCSAQKEASEEVRMSALHDKLARIRRAFH